MSQTGRHARTHAVLSGTCCWTVALLQAQSSLPTSLYSGQHFGMSPATGNRNHLNSAYIYLSLGDLQHYEYTQSAHTQHHAQ